MTNVFAFRAVRTASPGEAKDSLSSPKEASERLEPRKVKGAKSESAREKKGHPLLLSQKAKQEKGHLLLSRRHAGLRLPGTKSRKG